ncbi:protein-glutamate methylesterase/protein-glutamine glutaminase [Aromatoleum buckelii]|uniref:Protein-glutamate methylesterase/protein-glutamine glutaminase n=1 Tax=Aromatoleum buckelii TaxID=200254 RepID=A0ABX1N5Y6_9RHOO|nr:chemotaxis response regulator protein-glutamate methylesterase [Aromatoleum buckelii]MCK0509621.1 chemotaxis response regulator protein-glutamate methylesterase [Aromatoleum buckelii]
MSTAPIRVMIVDDSAVVRQVVSDVVTRAPGMEVMATASDPLFALGKLRSEWPDVIVLDIEMPRMDGLSFLRRVMAEHPTPVIICSSLAESGSAPTMDALAAGAFAVIPKPRAGLKDFLQSAAEDIVTTIRSAARANPRRLLAHAASAPPRPKLTADAILTPAPASAALRETTDKVLALGTSTGGTQALEAVLTRLPVSVSGIVIVQHMPERFTAMFAERLDGLCAIRVREARHGDRVAPGLALIAPGGRHMMLRRSGAQYHVDVVDGPLVNRHKPAVDVLFRSVAKCAGKNAAGVIMTGMGDDGARGLLEMRESGAATIAQDETTSVVFGMPGEAIRLGAAERVLPLGQIPAALIQFSAAPR